MNENVKKSLFLINEYENNSISTCVNDFNIDNISIISDITYTYDEIQNQDEKIIKKINNVIKNYIEPTIIVKTEHYDENVLFQLINDDDFCTKDRSFLKKYNKERRISGGKAEVKYTFGVGYEKLRLGRLFPEFGLANIRFDMRNPLFQKKYWDIDFANCHFYIARHIMNEYNLQHFHIDDYINNRDEWLKKTHPDRWIAKSKFLITAYGGDIKLYNENYEYEDFDVDTDEVNNLLKGISNEIKSLMLELYNKNTELMNVKFGKKGSLNERKNPLASLLSVILQTKERELLLFLDWFLEKKGRHMDVLIHDGGLVRKLKDEDKFPEILLREAELAVELKFGIKIPITQKEIKHDYVLNDVIDESNVIICLTDKDAANYLFDILKNKLKSYDNGKRLFFLHNNIWKHDKSIIESHLLDFILNSNIYTTNTNGKIVPYAQNIKKAKNILEALINKIKVSNIDETIYNKFHTTTKGRICFLDGFLDFRDKKFYTWKEIEDLKIEYYSTVQIDRYYKDYFDNVETSEECKKDIDEIKKDIFENLYGDKINIALHFLSRALAGHYEDKRWATYLGNRNCGKGVEFDLLHAGFGKYVNSFELGNILFNRKTEGTENIDCSKKLYWLIELEFVRLAVSQETPDPKSGLKANSRMIKKMSGGGDYWDAKKNYDTENTKLMLDTTFYIKGNNSLSCDVNDCNENRLDFNSVVQFKTISEINQMILEKRDENEMKRYKVANPNIKNKCKSIEWMNAIVYIIYCNYKTTCVEVINDLDIENNYIFNSINELFEITNNKDDIILCSDVYDLLNDYDKGKVTSELSALNVFKKKSTSGEFRMKWCFFGLTKKI